ncbi:copper resistance D family protein [Actimicrobium antarcticum]|uniref:Copper resistance protein D domain-containing protein n=1 Tax=Actimicrobium antarcticum TaxID=1051899 RepID=A0ABP7SI97_9BURK
MDQVALLQISSALLLNVGFIWLVGSWFARRWLGSSGVKRNDVEPALRKLDLVAAGVSAVASVVALYAATAVMGGISLQEAGPMFWMMLSTTHYGHIGCLTILAMMILFAIRVRGGTSGASDTASLLTIVAFAITRASMGHAGENGILSVSLAAEVVHFFSIGLWTGAVIVSAYFVLTPQRVATLALAVTDRYLNVMSRGVMLAVILIIGTGLYNAWHRIGTVEQLTRSSYGLTLLVKIALVACAIGLGGYNKFFGLPAAGRSARGVAVVRRVLQIESVLLLGALAAAAILTSQQPPTAI